MMLTRDSRMKGECPTCHEVMRATAQPDEFASLMQWCATCQSYVLPNWTHWVKRPGYSF